MCDCVSVPLACLCMCVYEHTFVCDANLVKQYLNGVSFVLHKDSYLLFLVQG